MEKYRVISYVEVDLNKDESEKQIIDIKNFNTKDEAEKYIQERTDKISNCEACTWEIDGVLPHKKTCFYPNKNGFCDNNIYDIELEYPTFYEIFKIVS